MIHNYKFNKQIMRSVYTALLAIFSLTVLSCDPTIDSLRYELPESNSKADETPPLASFSSSVTSDYLTYTFGNTSSSATKYSWDYGDGNTSTNVDGINTYPAEGTYTVTLTATDKLGVISTFSETIEVVEPEAPAAIVPVINEAGFEDNDLDDGSGDGRDSWRISGGKIFGITSSPVRTGTQGAKFDKGDPRVAYQSLTVTPNTDYVVTIYYTMKEEAGGELRLAILGQAIDNASEAEAAIIASVTGTDNVESSDYVEMKLAFNSGATETIAIWIDSNNLVESRVDDVSIALAE